MDSFDQLKEEDVIDEKINNTYKTDYDAAGGEA